MLCKVVYLCGKRKNDYSRMLMTRKWLEIMYSVPIVHLNIFIHNIKITTKNG